MWDFVLVQEDSRLISGSSDGELRVWSLKFKDEVIKEDKDSEEPPQKTMKSDSEGNKVINESNEEEDDVNILDLQKLGSILRSKGDRVNGMRKFPSI